MAGMIETEATQMVATLMVVAQMVVTQMVVTQMVVTTGRVMAMRRGRVDRSPMRPPAGMVRTPATLRTWTRSAPLASFGTTETTEVPACIRGATASAAIPLQTTTMP